MNIDEKFSKKLFNFSIISTIILVVFLSISYIYIRQKRKELKQNWTTERCKPHIIPFAHYIKGFEEGPLEGSINHYKFYFEDLMTAKTFSRRSSQTYLYICMTLEAGTFLLSLQ